MVKGTERDLLRLQLETRWGPHCLRKLPQLTRAPRVGRVEKYAWEKCQREALRNLDLFSLEKDE